MKRRMLRMDNFFERPFCPMQAKHHRIIVD